jgi:hypothetical protein
MTELETKLSQEVDSLPWLDISRKCDLNNLIVIQKPLELIQAAAALAQDNADAIQKWLNEKLLFKPDAHQLEYWEKENPEFQVLIIQPFVLIQILKNPPV